MTFRKQRGHDLGLLQCSGPTPAIPQHFLNFFPLPQGQGSLRPTFAGAP